MTRSVGTLYLILASVVAGLSVAASAVTRDWSFLILGASAGLGGIVVSAVLSGLADIADELRQLRADLRGPQGTARTDSSRVVGTKTRETLPLWATANRTANASPLFRDDGGKPEPEPYSPKRTPPKMF
jgi:hypothetical protein